MGGRELLRAGVNFELEKAAERKRRSLGRGKEEEEFTTLDTRYSTFVTFVYTHTSSVSTFEVHHCTPYILRQYCFCSLFTLLTAALPQYCLA